MCNQIENKNPSGASEHDILNQAKMLLTQYGNYKKGFKFDHVWPILKEEQQQTQMKNTEKVLKASIMDLNIEHPKIKEIKFTENMFKDNNLKIVV
ncbi:unnamed protein product [Arabidopsis thaliana]|uniref:Uncharacterized protein n=1 Tax=Arabidopsis thaliana TaxID=3702 RepID=A0A654EG73_ARATH|nr:unnamed protein product [Arabidopsis thaliana]